MSSSMIKAKKNLTKFLRYIGADFNDEGVEIWPECSGDNVNNEDEEFCPEHKNCGICRYEYMKRKGWLDNSL